MFKPNLIPNNRDNKVDIFKLIEKNGGIKNYLVSYKKDGCRVEFLNADVKTRALKAVRSNQVNELFKPVAELLEKLDIILEGEFYSHGMRFNEIFRFFSNTDVTRKSVIKELEKKDILGDLEHEHAGRSVEWLTTFHDSLQVWGFDGYIKGHDQDGYLDRILDIIDKLKPYMVSHNLEHYLVLPQFIEVDTIEELKAVYEKALEDGWEGLVLTHKHHTYKHGRTTLNSGTLLKMKDDKNEYDGVIVDVEEGTNVKEGVERTKDELGNSKTSGCKGDREPSGMAKGFLCDFNGTVFTVGLQGFNNEAKVELLKNKNQYIGRHFKYVAMPPVKKVPRHAFFDQWRDPK